MAVAVFEQLEPTHIPVWEYTQLHNIEHSEVAIHVNNMAREGWTVVFIWKGDFRTKAEVLLKRIKRDE